MRICSHKDTCRVLYARGLPLGISCQHCQRRTLLRIGILGVHEHDYRPVSRLPLLCRCGSINVQRVILESPNDGELFLSGSSPETVGLAHTA